MKMKSSAMKMKKGKGTGAIKGRGLKPITLKELQIEKNKKFIKSKPKPKKAK